MQFPVEINHIKSEGVVRITWDDGHVGEYAQEYLRGYCPCALCQGHGAQRKFISVPEARLPGYLRGGELCRRIQMAGWPQYRHIYL